jgi:putative ABC transport system permease protein
LRLAVANLLTRKTRTAISVFAIGVGVMTLIVIGGVMEGSFREISNRLESVNAHMMVYPRSWNPFTDTSAILEAELAEDIAAVEGVDRVSPVIAYRISLAGQGHTVYGVRMEDFDEVFGRGRRIEEGRLPAPGAAELLVDRRLADAGPVEIGDEVQWIGPDKGNFRVVGIVATGVAARVFTPIETYRVRGIGTSSTGPMVSMFYVRARNGAASERVKGRIENKLPHVRALLANQYYTELLGTWSMVPKFLACVKAIAASISFMVIMLTMYTLTLERTREVGILKGLGASDLYIAKEVLSESLLLCAAGFVAGMILSYVVRYVVLALQPFLTIAIDPGLVAVTAVLCFVGGVLGALYPGWRAARSDPVESLSYE